MKKIHIVLCAFWALILAAGCVSKPEPSYAGPGNPNVPEFVLNPPVTEDAILGIGSAKLSGANISVAAAEDRALQSLALTLQAHVQAMIVDYARNAGNEGNMASLELIESVGRQLADAPLTVTVLKREQTPDGAFWVLLSCEKADAARTAAAIIAPDTARYAEFKALDALKMMDAQLSKSAIPPVPVTR
jgi:hypothetical protein